ncbi:MAG: type II secretion system GspH family protein [Desulfomonile sp.]|nr:type II secretion system GspH family protein [Desulfomonile sp.]
MATAISCRCDKGKGYSLIELMVVLAVVGIVLAIAVPFYVMYKRTVCDGTAEADLNNLKVALANLATEMSENYCTVVGADGNPALKTPANIDWDSTAIASLVGYYGWGGTSRKCDVRVRFVAASGTAGQPGYVPALFQAASALGRRPDGEKSANRWVYRIPAAGGPSLEQIKADPSNWPGYLSRNERSMGCGP